MVGFLTLFDNLTLHCPKILVDCSTFLNKNAEKLEQAKMAAHCPICLDSDGPLVQQGCACRGHAGLSHVACMVQYASHGRDTDDGFERWVECATCKQPFTGAMKHALAEAWWQYARRMPVVATERTCAEQHFAACLFDSGKYDEAARMLIPLLHVQSAQYGLAHPLTLGTSSILVSVLLAAGGRCDEAMYIQRRVLAGTIGLHGANHALTAFQMSALASTMGKQGELKEAVRLARSAVTTIRSCSCEDTQGFLTVASVLGALLDASGEYEDAEMLWREILRTRRRVLGHEHPETVQTTANLGATLSKKGAYEEAEILEQLALESMRRTLGASHPQTLGVEENLAYTLRCLLVGARVALRGLVAKPEYNGRVGTVLSKVGTRYKVALDLKADAISVKRDNIRVVLRGRCPQPG